MVLCLIHLHKRKKNSKWLLFYFILFLFLFYKKKICWQHLFHRNLNNCMLNIIWKDLCSMSCWYGMIGFLVTFLVVGPFPLIIHTFFCIYFYFSVISISFEVAEELRKPLGCLFWAYIISENWTLMGTSCC